MRPVLEEVMHKTWLPSCKMRNTAEKRAANSGSDASDCA